jgi:hypothetical protein
MTKPAPIPIKSPLAALTPLELLKKVSIKEAAAMNDLSPDVFRRHYGHLVKKISPRRCAVTIHDAITLPLKPT